MIGEDLVPDTNNARDATDTEITDQVYKGLSYQKFIRLVQDRINTKPYPKFLMVFLLSHGTEGDRFTLTRIADKYSCCGNRHDSVLPGLCHECHVKECKCVCCQCQPAVVSGSTQKNKKMFL